MNKLRQSIIKNIVIKLSISIVTCIFLTIVTSVDCFSKESINEEISIANDCKNRKIRIAILPLYDHADHGRIGNFKEEALSNLSNLIQNEFIEYEIIDYQYNLETINKKKLDQKEIEKHFWKDKKLVLDKADKYLKKWLFFILDGFLFLAGRIFLLGAGLARDVTGRIITGTGGSGLAGVIRGIPPGTFQMKRTTGNKFLKLPGTRFTFLQRFI